MTPERMRKLADAIEAHLAAKPGAPSRLKFEMTTHFNMRPRFVHGLRCVQFSEIGCIKTIERHRVVSTVFTIHPFKEEFASGAEMIAFLRRKAEEAQTP